MLRPNFTKCGEMTVDLLANRKHLNEIFGKCDLRNLEADVTSCVNGVNGIEIFARKHCIGPK